MNILISTNTPWEDQKKFYQSADWKELSRRFKNKNSHITRCPNCKRSWSNKVRVNVDHVLPLRDYFHLRLDENNLQILCGDCNKAKGSNGPIRAKKVLKQFLKEQRMHYPEFFKQ